MDRPRRKRCPSKRHSFGESVEDAELAAVLAASRLPPPPLPPPPLLEQQEPQQQPLQQQEQQEQQALQPQPSQVMEWVACDRDCKNGPDASEWFPLEAVGLQSVPEGPWQCSECAAELRDADAEAEMMMDEEDEEDEEEEGVIADDTAKGQEKDEMKGAYGAGAAAAVAVAAIASPPPPPPPSSSGVTDRKAAVKKKATKRSTPAMHGAAAWANRSDESRAAWWAAAKERSRCKLNQAGFLRNLRTALEQQVAEEPHRPERKPAKNKRKQSPGGGGAGGGGGGGRSRRRRRIVCATAEEVEAAMARGPNRLLLHHLLVFSLCQLRAQAERVLQQRDEFDEELARVEASLPPASPAPQRDRAAEGREEEEERGDDEKSHEKKDDDDDDDDDDAQGTDKDEGATSSGGDGGGDARGAAEALRELPSIAACEPLMRKFLEGTGKGDRWVPWNTAVGAHERYISERIYSLGHLSDRERYLLHFVFRGSSYVPLFEHIFVPIFEAEGAAEEGSAARRRWEEVLHSPDDAFRRGGPLHEAYRAYRALANLDDDDDDDEGGGYGGGSGLVPLGSPGGGEKLGKLHTSCYRPRPPKGMAGEEYTWYIVCRTRFFLRIGDRAYRVIEQLRAKQRQRQQQTTTTTTTTITDLAPQSSVPSSSSLSSSSLSSLSSLSSSSGGSSDCEALCSVFCEFHDIGPTMSKMFLVTTHLQYPELQLLADSCTVGDGAEQSFGFLYGLQPVAKPPDRERVLRSLFRDCCALAPSLEPRLLPMIRWTAQRTRERFASVIQPEAVPLALAVFELQVNLCEWRKFLKYDPRLTAGGGIRGEADAAAATEAMGCRATPKRKAEAAADTSSPSGQPQSPLTSVPASSAVSTMAAMAVSSSLSSSVYLTTAATHAAHATTTYEPSPQQTQQLMPLAPCLSPQAPAPLFTQQSPATTLQQATMPPSLGSPSLVLPLNPGPTSPSPCPAYAAPPAAQTAYC